jgi:hypothetical protein
VNDERQGRQPAAASDVAALLGAAVAVSIFLSTVWWLVARCFDF